MLLALAAVVFLVGWLIGRSRLGFALRIIGNDEVVAVHCGINTARAKVVLFVISSTFAAVTGALVAPRWSYVEPSIAFSPFLSFEVVIMALLGGVHRLWGPLVGRHSVHAAVGVHLGQVSRRRPRCCSASPSCSSSTVIPRGVVGLIEDVIARRASARIGGFDGSSVQASEDASACLALARQRQTLAGQRVSKRFGGLVARSTTCRFELPRTRCWA